jgi:hypothetical protein
LSRKHASVGFVLPIVGALLSSADIHTQALAQDANSTRDSGATTNLFSGAFDVIEPPAEVVDYSPPSTPTYNLSSGKLNLKDGEVQGGGASTKELRQEEAVGRVQTNGGSFGLETERKFDPSKVVPHNDFSESQLKKPDSFVGFSIVSPYDPK